MDLNRASLVKTFSVFLVCIVSCTSQTSQTKDRTLNKEDLVWLKMVLHDVHDDLRKLYYDPSFHGLDLDARFREAETKIESAKSLSYAVADIAGAVSALNDSHTVFLPPPRAYVEDYGWRMQPVDEEDCFITAVRPGSDAEKKGVKPGDQLPQSTATQRFARMHGRLTTYFELCGRSPDCG